MSKSRSFLWCLHCERAIEVGKKASTVECPYDDCDGGFGDIWEWSQVREGNPSYPEIPVKGVKYPLYGQ
jgi:hypothetical protein